MNTPDFEKVLSQDVSEAPTWFKNVLEPLNRLFEYIKDAFNANISVSNLKIQVIEFTFTAPYTQTSFNKTKSSRVVAVLLAQITPAGVFPINWIEQNGAVTIFPSSLLTVGVQYTIRLLVLY